MHFDSALTQTTRSHFKTFYVTEIKCIKMALYAACENGR